MRADLETAMLQLGPGQAGERPVQKDGPGKNDRVPSAAFPSELRHVAQGAGDRQKERIQKITCAEVRHPGGILKRTDGIGPVYNRQPVVFMQFVTEAGEKSFRFRRIRAAPDCRVHADENL